MSDRVTQSMVDGAFARLHRAMEWPKGEPWTKTENGLKANIGAVYLGGSGFGYQIEVIDNEMGGVQTPFTGWTSKREARDTMCAMASAVERFKRP